MGTATKKKPQRTPAPTPQAKTSTAPIITAYGIVKASIGQNLWQLVTYKIQDNAIIETKTSVEDLREILIARASDMIGAFQ